MIYQKYIKRFLDFFFSMFALIIFSPVFFIFTVVGAVVMGGNPFFYQERPGKNEKLFKLIKFRTMSNKCDEKGNLLPDEVRLSKYGKLLRTSSLDELPELLNILVGHMSVVGPRPLMVHYLTYYTEKEKHRHDVRPGLTGLAQVNGRSFISWEETFEYDLAYVYNVSFVNDIKIICSTFEKVFSHKNIADMTKAKKGKDGQLYFIVDGKIKILHRPLNIEREKMLDEKRNR